MSQTNQQILATFGFRTNTQLNREGNKKMSGQRQRVKAFSTQVGNMLGSTWKRRLNRFVNTASQTGFYNLQNNINDDNNIYVGIFLITSTYNLGINDTLNLLLTQYPNNNLVIQKYNIDENNVVPSTELSVSDFINKYPEGRRCTISERTSILTVCSNMLSQYNIPNFSLSATSPAVKTLPNCLTYAPYDKYSAMSLFLIFKDYSMSNLQILIQQNSQNNTFFNTYKDEVLTQAAYLSIPVTVDTLDNTTNKNYNILSKTHIILLAETSYINNLVSNTNFISQLNSAGNCYITLTDINEDINNIFQQGAINIPAIVLLPKPNGYTPSTQLVYNNLTNKNTFNYFIYSLFDIVYKLLFLSNTNNQLTVNSFISYDPFAQNNTLPAWSLNLVFNPNINGYEFGNYSALFTRNIFFENFTNYYDPYLNTIMVKLPQSTSEFLIIGIVPFFVSQIYYDTVENYKVYDSNDNLILVGNGNTNSFYPNDLTQNINGGFIAPVRFIYKYNSSNYFSVLNKLFDDINFTPLQVNNTMSRTYSEYRLM